MNRLLLILMLVACSVPKEYTATFTHDRLIGSDDVRTFERVTRVEKRGWLTSDRYLIYTADGQVHVLDGQWDVVLLPAESGA